MNIVGTKLAQSRYKPHHDPTCPSCDKCVETCVHVLSCNEAGRVDALYQSINLLDNSLKKVGMHTKLCKYLRSLLIIRGGISMTDVLHGTVRRYSKLSVSQDLIGWRRFMEGMISKDMLVIQQEYLDLRGDHVTPTTPIYWDKGIIVRMIEITHGQWLYQNVHVHDTATGLHATHRKEELQKEVEYKIHMGGEELAEDDKYLLDYNLEDMETTSRERQ